MKTLAVAAIGMALVGTAAVAQQTAVPAAAVESPEAFVTVATSSNMFEVQSSELALEKSEDETVEEYAEHMIEDHTAAAEDMMAAVAEDGITPPPMALDAKHQTMLDQLQAAEGEEFDTLYKTMQLQAHEESVALFSAFVEEGDEGAVSAFAAEKLPVLEEHLEMAEEDFSE